MLKRWVFQIYFSHLYVLVLKLSPNRTSFRIVQFLFPKICTIQGSPILILQGQQKCFQNHTPTCSQAKKYSWRGYFLVSNDLVLCETYIHKCRWWRLLAGTQFLLQVDDDLKVVGNFHWQFLNNKSFGVFKWVTEQCEIFFSRGIRVTMMSEIILKYVWKTEPLTSESFNTPSVKNAHSSH